MAETTSLYKTTTENRTLEIEKTLKEDMPFLFTLTVRKLGLVTSVYYFVSREEAQEIVQALSA